MQVCTSLQTDNHASTPPLSFLQAGCPSCRPTNSVKALKALALKALAALAVFSVHITYAWCTCDFCRFHVLFEKLAQMIQFLPLFQGWGSCIIYLDLRVGAGP